MGAAKLADSALSPIVLNYLQLCSTILKTYTNTITHQYSVPPARSIR